MKKRRAELRMNQHIKSKEFEKIEQHNHLIVALINTAASAHLAPLKEELLLPGAHGHGDRPADVLLPNFASIGQHMAVDVCVVSH